MKLKALDDWTGSFDTAADALAPLRTELGH